MIYEDEFSLGEDDLGVFVVPIRRGEPKQPATQESDPLPFKRKGDSFNAFIYDFKNLPFGVERRIAPRTCLRVPRRKVAMDILYGLCLVC